MCSVWHDWMLWMDVREVESCTKSLFKWSNELELLKKKVQNESQRKIMRVTTLSCSEKNAIFNYYQQVLK